jgi:hypothetical protein
LGHGLDADLLQVRQQLGLLWPGTQVKDARPVREVSQWTPHGLSEQVGSGVDGGRLLAHALGQDFIMVMAQDDAPPPAVVFGILTRNGEEVSLPGFVYSEGGGC